MGSGGGAAAGVCQQRGAQGADGLSVQATSRHRCSSLLCCCRAHCNAMAGGYRRWFYCLYYCFVVLYSSSARCARAIRPSVRAVH